MPILPTEDELANHLGELLALLQPMIHDRALLTEDHYGLMCLFFLTRQVEHGESLLKIRPSFDCELIARSMLEGYCQHAWAAGDPENRGTRWRGYAYVHDWVLLHDKKEQGETVPEEEEEGIRAQCARASLRHGFFLRLAL